MSLGGLWGVCVWGGWASMRDGLGIARRETDSGQTWEINLAVLSGDLAVGAVGKNQGLLLGGW